MKHYFSTIFYVQISSLASILKQMSGWMWHLYFISTRNYYFKPMYAVLLSSNKYQSDFWGHFYGYGVMNENVTDYQVGRSVLFSLKVLSKCKLFCIFFRSVFSWITYLSVYYLKITKIVLNLFDSVIVERSLPNAIGLAW